MYLFTYCQMKGPSENCQYFKIIIYSRQHKMGTLWLYFKIYLPKLTNYTAFSHNIWIFYIKKRRFWPTKNVKFYREFTY